MPLITCDNITRNIVRANPSRLFVFGDNMARAGFGGQALAMRGEPNAVGIPTKWKPSMAPDAFFTDADFDAWLAASQPDFARLAGHLRANGIVVWPAAGIGTGRAQLERRAPRIWRWIDKAHKRLMEL